MKTVIVYPQNKFLKKYLKYFLFIKNDDSNYNKKHVSFPNTNHCLGLYKGNKLVSTIKNEYSIIEHDGYHSYLTGIYDKPVTFHFSGVFDEICIEFEPLGVEYLIGKKVSCFKFFNSIIENLLSDNWHEIYSVAFRVESPYLRAQFLEKFILKNITKNLNVEFIPFNQIYEDKVDALKATFNLSYRSIHRLYYDSLGISPKEFLKITRFRRSINYLSFNETQSQLAYLNGYSDQSHLIRDFKSYTNLTPRQFTKQVDSINNDVWLAVK